MNSIRLWWAITWRIMAIVTCVYLSIRLSGCATGQAERGTKLVKRACVEPVIISHTPETWQRRDQLAFQTATNRCEYFYPRSPCLKKFIRYQVGRYAAICGGGTEENAFEWRDG